MKKYFLYAVFSVIVILSGVFYILNEESSKTYNKLIDLICKHYKLKG